MDLEITDGLEALISVRERRWRGNNGVEFYKGPCRYPQRQLKFSRIHATSATGIQEQSLAKAEDSPPTTKAWAKQTVADGPCLYCMKVTDYL
jgi:hypothetical protein